jgi:hypothetical protein
MLLVALDVERCDHIGLLINELPSALYTWLTPPEHRLT